MNTIRKSDYQSFVEGIKEKIHQAQYQAMKAVVENLSKDLQYEFPGTKGYSAQNLWYMRQVYLEYKAKEKLQPLVGEIRWSKNDLQKAF